MVRSVCGRVIEDGVDVFEGAISAITDAFRIGPGCSHVGPVDDETCITREGHVFGGPTIRLKDGCASGDCATGGEDAEGEDAVGSCRWDNC